MVKVILWSQPGSSGGRGYPVGEGGGGPAAQQPRGVSRQCGAPGNHRTWHPWHPWHPPVKPAGPAGAWQWWRPGERAWQQRPPDTDNCAGGRELSGDNISAEHWFNFPATTRPRHQHGKWSQLQSELIVVTFSQMSVHFYCVLCCEAQARVRQGSARDGP